MWISVFILVVLVGSTAVTNRYAQASVDCSRQIFSLVDCPPPSSSEEDVLDNSDDSINVDSGNIEEQIPSVIPFSQYVILVGILK